MLRVIIPAHNEEAVIGRCLGTLLAAAPPGALEVIVVANGCSDRTAATAAAFGPPDVRVVELGQASEHAAIHLPAFIAVTTIASQRARRKLRTKSSGWERDDSSRPTRTPSSFCS